MAARGRRRGQIAGVALALAFHGAVIGYLSHVAGRLQTDYRVREDVPTFHVEIQKREIPERRTAPAAPAPRRAAIIDRKDIGPVPEPFVSQAVGAEAGVTAEVGAGSQQQGAGASLKGLGGCARLGLSRQEREDCEAQRWAKVERRPKLDLDPGGRYAERTDPFLSRRPTNGCRIRATGDVGGFGDDANARAGITCVKPF